MKWSLMADGRIMTEQDSLAYDGHCFVNGDKNVLLPIGKKRQGQKVRKKDEYVISSIIVYFQCSGSSLLVWRSSVYKPLAM